MAVNTAKLKGLIVERGTSQRKVADAIGIDRTTFYRKMKNGGNSFTIGEAQKIAKNIPLEDSEAIEIFLGQKPQKRYFLDESTKNISL